MAEKKHSLIIHTRLEEQVSRTPDILALLDNDRSFTYDQLNKQANQIAHAIVELLGTENNTVAVLLEHGAMSIIGIYAVLKAAKVAVSLDVDHPIDHNQRVIINSGAIGIITNNKNILLGKQIASHDTLIINIDELSDDLPISNLNLSVSPTDYARMTYSSGSTGNPKGIVREHRSLTQSPVNHSPGERISHILSLAFSASSGNIFNPLFGGGAVCCYDIKERGLGGVADWLIDDKITNFNPQLLVLRHLNRTLPKGTLFPDIQTVKLAGQVIFKQDIEKFRQFLSPQAVIRHALGSTEVGLISFYDIKVDTVLDEGVVPVGIPFEATEITLLGEDGKQVPMGEIGSIAVTGNRIASGYWNNEKLTAQKFIPGKDVDGKRTFLSDDLGRWRSDGMLEFLGRKDFEVK
ncbi:MAG: AMP-binding protein, partial [Chloroflexota bacterium]